MFNKKLLKKLSALLTVTAAALSFGACNSDDDITNETNLPYSCQLLNFALSADSSVCQSLDTVFFSIDQLSGEIFNADSLPMGSNITRLVPRITVATASVLEIYEPREGKADSVHNYIEHPGDSLDFSRGPVRLRIVSADGQSSASYSVRVLVHKSNPDTLTWSRLERAGLPSQFTVVTDQGTAHTADTFWCMTYYDGRYCMARATDPDGVWSYATPQLGFTPVLSSLNATESALFMLDTAGNLMTSTDGVTWTATGQNWTNIYGAHRNKLLGCTRAAGAYNLVTYPASSEEALPDGFPVSGASQTITYTFDFAGSPQTIITGGRCADGSLCNVTWGYDGNSWASISRRALPYALDGATVVPYFTADVNQNTLKVTRKSVLIAMFGKRSDGALNDTVYVSPDFGMNWEKAGKLLQQAALIPGRSGAKGFIYKQTLHVPQKASRSQRWTSLVPTNTSSPAGNIVSRPAQYLTKPVSEWECPYIYLFGGYNAQGALINTLYRGVIQRFTFIPIE